MLRFNSEERPNFLILAELFNLVNPSKADNKSDHSLGSFVGDKDVE
jgi:hypothetical protein